MRILLTAAVMIFSVSAFAQAPSNPALQSLMDKFKKDNRMGVELTVPPATINVPMPKQPVYSHTLPSGSQVYSLPQDNMPCVVPREMVSNMPVIRGDLAHTGPGTIPNAGYGPMVMMKQAIINKALMRKR